MRRLPNPKTFMYNANLELKQFMHTYLTSVQASWNWDLSSHPSDCCRGAVAPVVPTDILIKLTNAISCKYAIAEDNKAYVEM